MTTKIRDLPTLSELRSGNLENPYDVSSYQYQGRETVGSDEWEEQRAVRRFDERGAIENLLKGFGGIKKNVDGQLKKNKTEMDELRTQVEANKILIEQQGDGGLFDEEPASGGKGGGQPAQASLAAGGGDFAEPGIDSSSGGFHAPVGIPSK